MAIVERAAEAAQHRETLSVLTRAGGSIDAEGPFASQTNPEWFSQATMAPTPARAREHREILAEFCDKAPAVKRERVAVFLAGPPGAGKTTAQDKIFKSTGTTEVDWRILNADDFKDVLLKRAIADGSYDSVLTPPEVAAAERTGERVWPRERAALVHEESSMLMKRARDTAIRRGENVIIDGTLANETAGINQVKILEEQGYTVRVTLVDGPKHVTAARVAYRWERGYEESVGITPPGSTDDPDVGELGGRWVPAEVTDRIYSAGDEESICARSARAVADSSTAVTELEVYRIDSPEKQPVLVERRSGKNANGNWRRINRLGTERRRHHEVRAVSRHVGSRSSQQPATGSGKTPVDDGSPRCVVCGRPLRSAESIARGAGPTCAHALE